MDHETLEHFGLERDPFVWAELFESGDVKALRRQLRALVADRGWLSVIGTPGSGKTFALEHLLAELDVHYCELLCAERSRMSAGLIDEALMYGVGDEPIRRSREARRRQMRRVLGEASRQKPVLLKIDESTHVRPNVWSEVKLIRDTLRYGTDPKNHRRQDPRPLFSVLMVGWPSLADRIRRSSELRPRIQLFEMKGLTRAEVSDYVVHLGLASAVPKRVRDAIADRARRPLLVNERVQVGLTNAWLRGASTLRVEDIALNDADVFLLAQQHGISQADVVKATGLSKGTVSQVWNGKEAGETSKNKVLSHLTEKLADLRAQEDDRQEAVA